MIRAIIRDSHVSTANTAETIAKVPSNAAIHMVESSRFAQAFAKLLILGLFVSIIAMLVLPWQQTSRGTGRVIAFNPQEREQSIEAPIKGVVLEVNKELRDGTFVKKGEFLLEIQPEAFDLGERLEEQLTRLRNKLRNAEDKVKVNEDLVAGFKEAGEFAVSAAREQVESAKAKLKSKAKEISGKETKVWQAQLDYNRQYDLWEDGAKPKKLVEKLKAELDFAKADLESAQEDVNSLQQELLSKKSQLKEKQVLALAKVNEAQSKLEDARQSVQETNKTISEVSAKRSPLNRNRVLAPRDGFVFRMPLNAGGQTVKQGDKLLTFIPVAEQKSVELMINGNDLPLVQIGQEVRLQFEGWPAVQFAGWPSIAIGTFSGRVATIDPTDNGKGEFRVMVLPNEELIENYENQAPWPEDRFLRQGVRANGWVMLNRVSLGYEIWRQLNGFPVMLDEAPEKEKAKPPKLPK